MWRLYVEEQRDEALTELIVRSDRMVGPLREAHEAHVATVTEVERALDQVGAQIVVQRTAGEPFECDGLDLVITVGGDGTLLAASHYVGAIPVLAINSAPSHSVGFFCGAKSGDALDAISSAIRGSLRSTVLTRMQVAVNGTVSQARVLNDALFCHASPAATSRYVVRLGEVEEEQKSSGFWIGPAAGSTAAQRSAGGRVLPFSSTRLQLVVREPYTPHGESYRFRHVLVGRETPVTVLSKVRDGRLFFDGPDSVLAIHYGDVVQFTQAPEPLRLLGISARHKWGH
jgi:NAD+ kinase